jgi:arabinogalactan endo-1,4-beta-galactosidase
VIATKTEGVSVKSARGASQLFHLANAGKIILIFLILSLAFCACRPTDIETLPAPTVEKPPPRPSTTFTTLHQLAVDQFDQGATEWTAFAQDGAVSEVNPSPDGGLQWSVELAPELVAGLTRNWSNLAEADGLTITLTSLDRAALLILGVQEVDGSAYSVVLPLEQGEQTQYVVAYEEFGLQAESEDENGRLDPEQLISLGLIDFTGFIASPNPNRVIFEEIIVWEGELDRSNATCAIPERVEKPKDFRIGVDANFVPIGEEQGYGFWVGEARVDPLELLAVNGANAFRLRLFFGEKGESKLDYVTELAKRAEQVGLKPYLILFLSDDWADVNKQPAPAVWANLTLEERAEAIHQYTRETVEHLIQEGITLDFYEIGNEIDHGIAGVFADTKHPRDPQTLRGSIWLDEARLIKAAIEGVRSADPEGKILLHIATSWSPDFASAFFQAMIEQGVNYDYVGLSFYPSAFGPLAANQFCKTLDRLAVEIGKPIIIAETAYPAEPPTGGLFNDWRRSIYGYPLTPEGQAQWLADFLAAMWSRVDVLGVYIFSPAFWFSGELWGPLALFDHEGQARPAVGSLNLDP